MTPIGLHNICKVNCATVGTGTLTLGSAYPGFNTPANAGVVNTELVTYLIRDGAQSEVGLGTYTSSGTTLSRDVVHSSTNGGAKINCSGSNMTVALSLAAEDLQPFASYYGSGGTLTNNTDGNVLTLNTEWVDQFGLASVSGNQLTVAKKGWYIFLIDVQYTGAGAFNGRVVMNFQGYELAHGYTTAMGIDYNQFYMEMLLSVTDNQNLGSITVDNHAGESIDYGVYELTLLKVGRVL